MATFLDPRHKSLKFVLNPAERDAVHGQIISLLDACKSSNRQESGEPQPKKNKKVIFSCLDGDFAEVNECVGIDAEVERYIAEPVHIRNPLMWWKHYEQRFPSLAILARNFLCVMGTSVPSERVFSIAGLTVTKTRAKLKANVVDEIVFLNKALNNSDSETVSKQEPAVKIKKESGTNDQAGKFSDEEDEADSDPELPSLY